MTLGFEFDGFVWYYFLFKSPSLKYWVNSWISDENLHLPDWPKRISDENLNVPNWPHSLSLSLVKFTLFQSNETETESWFRAYGVENILWIERTLFDKKLSKSFFLRVNNKKFFSFQKKDDHHPIFQKVGLKLKI